MFSFEWNYQKANVTFKKFRDISFGWPHSWSGLRVFLLRGCCCNALNEGTYNELCFLKTLLIVSTVVVLNSFFNCAWACFLYSSSTILFRSEKYASGSPPYHFNTSSTVTCPEYFSKTSSSYKDEIFCTI